MIRGKTLYMYMVELKKQFENNNYFLGQPSNNKSENQNSSYLQYSVQIPAMMNKLKELFLADGLDPDNMDGLFELNIGSIFRLNRYSLIVHPSMITGNPFKPTSAVMFTDVISLCVLDRKKIEFGGATPTVFTKMLVNRHSITNMDYCKMLKHFSNQIASRYVRALDCFSSIDTFEANHYPFENDTLFNDLNNLVYTDTAPTLDDLLYSLKLSHGFEGIIKDPFWREDTIQQYQDLIKKNDELLRQIFERENRK